MTKDRDFVRLLQQHGAPPKIVWITAGNTASAHLRVVLEATLERALLLLEEGESLVEIRDAALVRLVSP